MPFLPQTEMVKIVADFCIQSSKAEEWYYVLQEQLVNQVGLNMWQ